MTLNSKYKLGKERKAHKGVQFNALENRIIETCIILLVNHFQVTI